MNYTELRAVIKSQISSSFTAASENIERNIFQLDRSSVVNLITEIGTIPEDIAHDSTEEKLYTKTSDILFAKALELMDFDVMVLRERADSADIVAKSKYHSYSLVGDAKAFRLSRTAKNAKDFKVDAMVHWKGSNDFSVLACPYFQYPKTKSQIFKEALIGNVCLFSWEYLYIMLQENIKESQDFSLKDLWNQSSIIGQSTTIENIKSSFIEKQNISFNTLLNISSDKFNNYFDVIKRLITERGEEEILFYENEIARIKMLNREEAIKELLKSMKLDSKIDTIKQFINQVNK